MFLQQVLPAKPHTLDSRPNFSLGPVVDGDDYVFCVDPTKVQARLDAQWTQVRSQQRDLLYKSDWTREPQVPDGTEGPLQRHGLRGPQQGPVEGAPLPTGRSPWSSTVPRCVTSRLNQIRSTSCGLRLRSRTDVRSLAVSLRSARSLAGGASVKCS